jgi:hypothetical protein
MSIRSSTAAAAKLDRPLLQDPQFAGVSNRRSTWNDFAVINHAPLMQWYER